MPSTSARCAQFPRATDKVHFFIQLKHLRDQLRGFPATDDVIDLAKATGLLECCSCSDTRGCYVSSDATLPLLASHLNNFETDC